MFRFDYGRILVPTDMSDFARLALGYAGMFRDRIGSEITVLYADEVYMPIDALEAPLAFYLETVPESRERMARQLQDHATAAAGGNVETMIATDSPARAIVTTAKRMRADLIIMGTHGRTGLRRALLGSVTESVLHETEVPVMTVTPGLMEGKVPKGIRHILCPVNFTYVAREALRHASALAQIFDALVSVMYVAEGVDQVHAVEVETAFAQWVEPQLLDRCRFERVLVSGGDPAEQVLRASQKADMIVVGAQHRFFSDSTVIGTTTQRITRFARVPVLTVGRRARREVFDERAARELTTA